MSYPNNEGPTLISQRVVIVDEYITCQGCKFHTHTMVKSGRDPIYSDMCTHPDRRPGLASQWQGNLFREEDQHLITPEWCPFLKQQSII